MAADLLEGATRVLEERGAKGFTTNHVAQATGASIGSLYQYYPNKASLLLALHDRDAEQLWQELERVLSNRDWPARERFVTIITATLRAQHQAGPLQEALHGAEVAAPEGPGFSELEARAIATIASFLREAIPAREGEHEELARYVVFVVFSILDRLAREPLDDAALEDAAARTSRMLADFVGL